MNARLLLKDSDKIGTMRAVLRIILLCAAIAGFVTFKHHSNFFIAAFAAIVLSIIMLNHLQSMEALVAEWRATPLFNAAGEAICPVLLKHLEDKLMPREVYRIAVEIHQRVPGAQLFLEKLGADPILKVEDKATTHWLAVWERETLIAGLGTQWPKEPNSA